LIIKQGILPILAPIELVNPLLPLLPLCLFLVTLVAPVLSLFVHRSHASQALDGGGGQIQEVVLLVQLHFLVDSHEGLVIGEVLHFLYSVLDALLMVSDLIHPRIVLSLVHHGLRSALLDDPLDLVLLLLHGLLGFLVLDVQLRFHFEPCECHIAGLLLPGRLEGRDVLLQLLFQSLRVDARTFVGCFQRFIEVSKIIIRIF